LPELLVRLRQLLVQLCLLFGRLVLLFGLLLGLLHLLKRVLKLLLSAGCARASIDVGGMAATNTPSMSATAAAMLLTHVVYARYRRALCRT
jgi:hypothetical protein